MQHGGKRVGAGRHKGRPNKATEEVRKLAGKYAPAAIKELGRLIKHAESEVSRVAAIKEILDRTYGKSRQPIEGEMLLGISEELQRLINEHDGETRGVGPVR